jgi:hypothetical protein
MPISMQWPPRRTPQGGLARTTRQEESTKQVIALALTPGFSANPWELQSGIGWENPTFDDLQMASTRIRRRINDRFRGFERAGRARLIGTPVFAKAADGRLQATVRYTDLEVGTTSTVTTE